jgi:DNA polymerase III subunit chi
MTAIEFHFNVPDKLLYGCRLLRKACRSGARVVVTGPEAQLAELDSLLWSFSATDFVPHARHGADEKLVKNSPVLLVESPSQCTEHDVLVNLGESVPAEFERFTRFIELVSREADDRAIGRSRWKHYAARGYNLERRDLAGEESA